MAGCFHCGREIPFEGRVPREESCAGCDRDLRCCRNCRFYDPSLSQQCSEPQAEWVQDKERANFCDLFSLGSARGGAGGAEGDRARAAWNKLFGGG